MCIYEIRHETVQIAQAVIQLMSQKGVYDNWMVSFCMQYGVTERHAGPRITTGQRTMTGQKCPVERSLSVYLACHFDRPHFHAFQCDCWHLELKHETMMYRNKFLIVCFTVSVSVSMTGQKQILTELKSCCIRDLSPVILSPYMHYYIPRKIHVYNLLCLTKFKAV
jgi:hypothetical protein